MLKMYFYSNQILKYWCNSLLVFMLLVFILWELNLWQKSKQLST